MELYIYITMYILEDELLWYNLRTFKFDSVYGGRL